MPNSTSLGDTESLSDKLSQLNLSESYLKRAYKKMCLTYGDGWKDENHLVCYTPEIKIPKVRSEKAGDSAEKHVMKIIEGLPKYLKEPLFVIPGREYCYYNTEAEQNQKRFVIGESDLLLFTRNQGFISIEVKDQKKPKVADFQSQTAKNLDNLSKTLDLFEPHFSTEEKPEFRKKKRNILRSDRPAYIAMPSSGKKDIDFPNLQANGLFKEDLEDTESLFKYFEDKILVKGEKNCGLSKDMIDHIIAGLFSLTGRSFIFPDRSVNSASNALHLLTEDQADLMVQTESQKLNILGPPGTGKTWMLINSVMKLYFKLKKGKRKGRILVVAYNKAIKVFIEDSIKKLRNFESPLQTRNEKDDIDIKVFTIDGLKEYLKKTMKGKIVARNQNIGSNETMEELEDFQDVFKKYYSSSTEGTFLDNFGFCGIFIDEGQNISVKDGEWLKKLWKRYKTHVDCNRFWMFGDSSQFLYSFKGRKKDNLAAKAYEEGDYRDLKQIVRNSDAIFECYHPPVCPKDENSELQNVDCIVDPFTMSVCPNCDLKKSRVHTKLKVENVETKEIPHRQVVDEIATSLKTMKETEKISLSDMKKNIQENLKPKLDKKLQNNLEFVESEAFALRRRKLKGRKRKHSGEENKSPKQTLLIDTVRCFQGLDSEVVILIDDRPDDPDYLTLLYVGQSRAMVKLLVINVV